MESPFDEFSKSLAASVPRRESLRLIGAGFAGAMLSLLGLGTAWAGRRDPCRSFCRCSNRKQQDQCLATCRACNGDTRRMGGACGSYACCSIAACSGVCSDLTSDPNCGACGNNCRGIGETCCGNYCADLDNDFDNCGRCGAPCDAPGLNEEGACVRGACVYGCAEGTGDCGDGTCTYLGSDADNCGACGNVCPASAPHCNQGVCGNCPPGLADCGGYCADLANSSTNCGACFWVCDSTTTCSGGSCQPVEPYDPGTY